MRHIESQALEKSKEHENNILVWLVYFCFIALKRKMLKPCLFLTNIRLPNEGQGGYIELYRIVHPLSY